MQTNFGCFNAIRMGVVLLLLCIAPWACLNIQKETPTKHRFVLQLERPASFLASLSRKQKPGLQIRRMQIAGSFSGRNFVYKISENEFAADYYNEFLVPPNANIRSVAVRWFEASPLFARVLAPSSHLRADYILESNIYLLYGDFHKEPPVAVMEIKFVLLEAQKLAPVLEKIYREKSEIAGKAAPALVAGYKKCLANILMRLEKDLALALEDKSF